MEIFYLIWLIPLFIVTNAEAPHSRCGFDVHVFTGEGGKEQKHIFHLTDLPGYECMSSLPSSFKENIMSLNTNGGCVNAYKTDDCQGEFAVIRPRSSHDLSNWPGWGDAIRSIGLCFDLCDKRMKSPQNLVKDVDYVVLHEHKYYRGEQEKIQLEHGKCQLIETSLRNKVSSVSFFGNNTCVELHKDEHCSGFYTSVRVNSPKQNLGKWWQADDNAVAISPCGFQCPEDVLKVTESKKVVQHCSGVQCSDELPMMASHSSEGQIKETNEYSRDWIIGVLLTTLVILIVVVAVIKVRKHLTKAQELNFDKLSVLHFSSHM